MTDQYKLKVTMPTDLEVVMQRSFNAPRSMVFEAWTNPEYLCRWMAKASPYSMPVCDVDLTVGGVWRVVLRDDSDGDEAEMRGTYRQIIRPELISWHEWWSGGQPDYINTIVLQEDGCDTIMTLTKLFKSKEDRDAAIKAGSASSEGAARGFEFLAGVLEEIVHAH
jgi:uncharacterized protein YndB with AHSA1/START domain